jgi:hypothetical protein
MRHIASAHTFYRCDDGNVKVRLPHRRQLADGGGLRSKVDPQEPDAGVAPMDILA